MARWSSNRPAGSAPTDDDVVRVGRVLGGLDPWSFWVIPGAPGKEHFRVVGTTGGFVVAACDAQGLLGGGSVRVIVGDRVVGGLRQLRRGAKRLRSDLHNAVVEAPVEPILCLTRATAGAPRTVRGVRVVTADRLVSLIADRSELVPRNRARRGAEALGMIPAREAGEEAQA